MVTTLPSDDFAYVASGAHSGRNAAGFTCRTIIVLADGTRSFTTAAGTAVASVPVKAGMTLPLMAAVTASTGAYLVLF